MLVGNQLLALSSLKMILRSFYLLHADDQADVHGVFQEIWYKIPSGSIASLRADSRFPNNPDVVNILQNFDAPFNFHNNYGQRLTAYLQVHYKSYGPKNDGSLH